MIYSFDYGVIYEVDYPGKDIGVERLKSYSECIIECDLLSHCIGFIMDRSNSRERCWLKHSIPNGIYFKDSSLFGIRDYYYKYAITLNTTKYTTSIHPNIDHYADDLVEYPDSSFANCHELCLTMNIKTKVCYGYVFNKPLGRGCWLKGAFNMANRQMNENRQLVILHAKLK